MIITNRDFIVCNLPPYLVNFNTNNGSYIQRYAINKRFESIYFNFCEVVHYF